MEKIQDEKAASDSKVGKEEIKKIELGAKGDESKNEEIKDIVNDEKVRDLKDESKVGTESNEGIPKVEQVLELNLLATVTSPAYKERPEEVYSLAEKKDNKDDKGKTESSFNHANNNTKILKSKISTPTITMPQPILSRREKQKRLSLKRRWKRLIAKHKNRILDMRHDDGSSQANLDFNTSRNSVSIMENHNRRVSRISQETTLDPLNESATSFKSASKRPSSKQQQQKEEEEQVMQKMKQEMKMQERQLYNKHERRCSRQSQQFLHMPQLQRQPTIEESISSPRDMQGLTNVDLNGEDEVVRKDRTQVRAIDMSGRSGDTYIRSAIPYLPRKAAVFCLLANIMIPGSGTMFCGVLGLACGQPRMPSSASTICINVAVGSMQLFTVPFLLVGWIWSLVWGIYFILLSEEQREIEKNQHETTLKAKVVGALDPSFRAWANQ